MAKDQIGFSLLGAITLVGACTYMAPSESNTTGSQGSSTATSTGQGGMGTSSSDAASSSSGGGQGGQGGTSSSGSAGAGGEGAGAGGAGGEGGATGSGGGSSSGGPTIDVNCGAEVCTGTTLCCIESGFPPHYTCADPGTCENAEVQCDGREDCGPDQLCCGMVNVTGQFLKLYCASQCGTTEIIVCHTDKMPTDCPAPLGCSALMTLGDDYGSCE